MSIRIISASSGSCITPSKAHSDDGGFDLYAATEANFIVHPGEVARIPTGYCWEIPQGYVGIIKDRSSMAMQGLHCVAGVIDSSYRGEVCVLMTNLTNESIWIPQGFKIAQLLIVAIHPANSIELVGALSETTRGTAGFGSSDL